MRMSVNNLYKREEPFGRKDVWQLTEEQATEIMPKDSCQTFKKKEKKKKRETFDKKKEKKDRGPGKKGKKGKKD